MLLTRARYETAIFVPLGDAADPTRDPVVYDGVVAFLLACGVRMVCDGLPMTDIGVEEDLLF